MIKVIRSGKQTLKNLRPSQLQQIKEELTLDNPAYLQVMKFSGYSTTNVPRFLTFYNEIGNSLSVPRGYKIPFEHKVVNDIRVERKIPYPKFKLELRNAQKEAYASWEKDTENGMIVLQTGKGKSILGCYMAYAKKQKTLIIVQKNDLVDGWMKDIELCFGLPSKKVGLIKAQKRSTGKQFTISTIQTISKLGKAERESLFEEFGMIIVDEVHHSPAKSYSLFQDFKPKYFVGLTATDQRPDGLKQVQYWLFGNVAYRSLEDRNDEDIMHYTVKVRESVIKYEAPKEYICGYRTVDEETAMYLKECGKKVTKKKLDPIVLKGLLVNDEGFNNMVARDILLEYKSNKSCVAFLHEKQHIRDLQDKLIEHGIPAEQIQLYYGDSKIPDSVMKERAESKEVLITLATFSKATEGTNIKAWERGFLVTSLNNEKNVIQAVGRCRRRKEGKEDVIIYDYSHPNIVGMSHHIHTRLKAYKLNKARILGMKKPLNSKPISRGWKK